MSNVRIVVTGSLAFDRIMNMPGVFRDHIQPDKLHILNVSFLVETLRTERGGTGGNIAYNLALLGVKPRLVAAIGRDGSVYKKKLGESGVDVSEVKVFEREKTATGHVITDRQDNQIWAFYVGAMRRSRELSIFSNSTNSSPGLEPGNKDRDLLVVIAPNDPKAVVKYVGECVKRGLDFVYDPAFQIPIYTKAQLKKAVEHAKIVVGNDYEIALIKKKLQSYKVTKLQRDQIWITTLGERGSVIERGTKKWRIAAAKPKKVVDPTGAGDAYRAGFLAGYIQGLPLPVCGRMGSVCAVYTVEKYGTQTHKFSLSEFKERYKENFREMLTL